MAIWITRILEGTALRLQVEGQIVGDWSLVLERECHIHRRERRVVLDLTHVSFVDTRGLLTLKDLRSRGFQFVNVPPLIEESLQDDPP